MKTILTWIDDRTGLCSGFESLCGRKVHRGISGCLTPLLAPMIVVCVITQALTGFFLWSYYSPSSQTAWESVYYIQYELAGGWLVRGIHHYSAQLLVFLIGLYLVSMVFRGVYRAPREFVFWIALVMGLFALGACLTGDLLPWTSYGYSSTSVRTRFLLLLPGIGGDLFKLAIGGPGPGLDSFTLTRFLALHIGVFGGGLIVLTVLWRLMQARADSKLLADGAPATWYWPNRAVLDMAAWAMTTLIILWLVAPHHGVGLGAPADMDPAAFDGTARPEWSFRALYELVHLFSGPWQIVPVFFISGGLVAFFFALPLIEKIRIGPMVRLPVGHLVNVGVVAVILLTGGYLTWHSYYADAHNAEYQADLAESRRLAERARELCQAGIPPSGALSLLLDDPKAQGPRLYKDFCLSCHSCSDAPGYDKVSPTPTAPNLGGIGSREWIAGWLDPEMISGPERFGNTSFANGSMARYIRSDFRDLKKDLGDEEFEKLLDLLTAEARLDAPRKFDAKTVEGLTEEDLYCIEDFGCTQCHVFYNTGSGQGPDLSGYCSRQWLIDFTKDPGARRFYGDKNEMPAYYRGPDDAQMTERQIEMTIDWMQGRWYEPPSASAE